MTLGQRIQELRKQRGMSQEALGDALGVSRQAVSKWEGDNGIPELDTLIAMSRLFEVTVGQLLGVEEAAEQKRETVNEPEEDKEDQSAGPEDPADDRSQTFHPGGLNRLGINGPNGRLAPCGEHVERAEGSCHKSVTKHFLTFLSALSGLFFRSFESRS